MSDIFRHVQQIYVDQDRLHEISLFGSQASSSKINNQVAVWVSVSL